MGTPLPPLDDLSEISEHPHFECIKTAYSLVRVAETSAEDDEALMNTRILGHFMTTFWILRRTLPDALPALAQEVVSLGDGRERMTVDQLGLRYREVLLRAFFRTSSELSDRSDDEDSWLPKQYECLQDLITYCLEGSTLDCRKLKARALVRDGFRCVVTRDVDRSAEKVVGDSEDGFERTECCHILSQSTAQGIQAVLKALGINAAMCDKLVEPNGTGVDCLENVLTLTESCRKRFDNLKLALEPCGPNEVCPVSSIESEVDTYQYAIRLYQHEGPRWRALQDKFITFAAAAGDDGLPLPLPDPQLLAIHAACARVGHISGAVEFFEKWDREAQRTFILSSEDNSYELLFSQLQVVAFKEQ
ncbi:hypothetical protein EXIGLDRAFT_764054 [Exidia glandulosa HHB12029]|uniref:HNH nuclease domain-containing protein n=1 Tax=Exidia glandulosa HHB12029 TaxID=1314781 RepID=A0A165LHJ9_EXIGL|nr:hypothetical protein EXIGLDRAFT_764054 [Exidia glandulosa HHB12029]